ncbi:restriction endonuclease subunit S [Photobacterium phosphoreum]|uniref:restriction endonuclease subunit S n=1 Tax=Photobacterium phosphoreum TaxID=659 RepID=UPI000D170D9C|nr:restriction endonuclease subunit S [Photobacterium phosphoreum]PSW30452.1 restriction endonuclease subunit S [Photobacterium phosphoreum]
MSKYQNYPDYKKSDIEWMESIPTHWKIVRLNYIFEIKKRIANTLGLDVLSVTQRGIKVKDIESGDGQLSMDYSKYQRVYVGDFAMNHMDLLTGYIDISKFNGVTSPDYRVFSVRDTEQYDARYYLYLLQMGYKQKLFFHLGQGSAHLGRWRLPTEAFNNIEYPQPSKLEQTQIAAFLDHETAKIDTLIEKQQKLIELLKEKRQAVISHAVTKGLNPDAPMKDSGVEWLGEVPAHWNVSKLKFECEIVDCRNKTPEYFDNGDYFVVRTTNVKNQKLNFNGALYTDKKNFDIWTQRGIPPEGSILFTREAPTGEVCLVPKDLTFCMGQRMMNFIANDNSYTDYLFDYLISDCLDRYINSVSHGSTVSHLRVEQVENIPVLVPSLDEIKQIHLKINLLKSKFDAIEKEAIQAIALMQERRTALISAAVTGKIDVRNWVAPTTSSDTTEVQQEVSV